jgi:hypothetical protein
MSEEPARTCGHGHPHDDPSRACEICQALRDAAAAGAQPPGVPLRVYGGYLEARAALRANASAAATRTLQWLLAHLAEERGAAVTLSFSAKVERLRQGGVISPRIEPSLLASAMADDDSPEQAWALMSIVEHAFYRLYLRKN